MNKRVLLDEVLKLEPADRLEIVQEILHSFEGSEIAPLTPKQVEEIERRLEDYERDPNSGAPWEEVLARVRARFK
jgi:putative addiction module component (TIGR02574 family)